MAVLLLWMWAVYSTEAERLLQSQSYIVCQQYPTLTFLPVVYYRIIDHLSPSFHLPCSQLYDTASSVVAAVSDQSTTVIKRHVHVDFQALS